MPNRLPPDLEAELKALIEKYRVIDAQQYPASGNVVPFIQLTRQLVKVVREAAKKYSCAMRVFVAAWLELVGNHPEYFRNL